MVKENMHNILIIDDNAALCRTISKMVIKMGMTAAYETSLAKGLERASAEEFDVVFLDVHLPDGSGLEGIGQIRNRTFPPEVIIITANGDEHGAETAIRNGVWDYIEKSTSFQNLKLALTRAVEYREHKKEGSKPVALKRNEIVGGSHLMSQCLDQVAQAANTDSSVLITGETGTGKELFARAIHENSRVFGGNFVVVDCAALPDHLVESILFGHRKGAFTGAHEDQEGLVHQAHNGTLFLDEIGELPQEIQKKFLRVIQEKQFRPVGSRTELKSNFRLVCATHRNLQEMVNQGKFRQDLFYRIRSIQIELPPLRNRTEDIPSLVLDLIIRNKKNSGRSHGLSPDFLESLQAYEWPGNVRELRSIMDRVFAAASDDPVLFSRHLPVNIRTKAVRQRLKSSTVPAAEPQDGSADFLETAELVPMKAFVEKMKYNYIKRLTQSANGDVAAACRISGLSRAYLYQLLNKYGIDFR